MDKFKEYLLNCNETVHKKWIEEKNFKKCWLIVLSSCNEILTFDLEQEINDYDVQIWENFWQSRV